MKIFDDAKMYARFALGLNKFLRSKITLEDARAIVRGNIEQRESNFLRVVKRGVFDYRDSPYRRLLQWAGCEFGDLEKLVRTDGLTTALRTLREAGVYVSFEEFKGREPIKRGSQISAVSAKDFDNPFTSPSYFGESSGSSGPGTRISHDRFRGCRHLRNCRIST